MTEASPVDDARDEALALWEIATLACMLLVSVAGNSLVLIALYLRRYHDRRRKLTRMYFFVLHLSVADLLTGLLNVLPQLAWDITDGRFRGGPVLCKMVKYVQPIGPYLSAYVLMATAIDRYHAICHPLSYCRTTSLRSKVMVYCAWILTLIFCLPQVVIFSYQEVKPGVWDCWATFDLPYGQKAYVTWYSVSVFLLPFCVLTYTYVGICSGVWRNGSGAIVGSADGGAKGLLGPRNRAPLVSRARINTVKQTIAVISLYVLSSSPFIGCHLWATWDPEAEKSPFYTGATFAIFSLLSSLNSCINPWIYLAFYRDLRHTLLDRLRRAVKFDSCKFNIANRGSRDATSPSEPTTRYALGTTSRETSPGREGGESGRSAGDCS